MFTELTLQTESQGACKVWINLSRMAAIGVAQTTEGAEAVAIFHELGSEPLQITIPEEVARIKTWLQVQEGNSLTSFVQTSRVSRERNN